MSDNIIDFNQFKQTKMQIAYAWAKDEMDRYFPKPDRFRITKLEEMTFKPTSHVSLFTGKSGDPVILRVYWYDTDSVKYSIVCNYDELKASCPEKLRILEAHAYEAYMMEMKKRHASDRSNRPKP